MTEDEIAALAHRTCSRYAHGSRPIYAFESHTLQDFARRLLAAEREACAAICGELESYWSAEKDVALLNGDVDLSNAASGEPRAARAIAVAIRARGATHAD